MAPLNRCAGCGEDLSPGCRFCLKCGEPRSGVINILARDARATGIPLKAMLEAAWAEDEALARERDAVREAVNRVDSLEERVSSLANRVYAIERAPAAVRARSRTVSARPDSIRRVRRTGALPVAIESSDSPELPLLHPIESLVTQELARLAESDLVADSAPRPAVSAPLPDGLDSMDSEAAARVETPQVPREPFLRPTTTVSPPPTSTPPRAARRSALDYEELISGRGLAWVGGLAVLVGAVFFLSLAFSRGWIGPSARVVIGVVVATAMIAGGGMFFQRKEATFGHVLVSVGLGIMSLSMLSATRLYDLIPIELGLAITLVSAGSAAMIAIRANLQVVAGYGIVAALAAPPVLGADPNGTTIAFLATALVGTTAIALYKTWRWLSPLAFVLTVPQFAVWVVDDAPVAAGMIALAGFWVLHAIAAGGEEFRIRKSKLSESSATLLMANAAFAVGAGFALLDGDAEQWRGTFLLAVAVAHGVLGGYFLRAEGDRHPFGMLAFGTGLAALTMAVPVQFGGNTVTLAWASEATALAWVYSKLKNPYGGGASVLLGAMSIAHLVTFEYPFYHLFTADDPSRPLFNGNGLTIAYLLGAVTIAGYFLRDAGLRRWMACLGGALLIWAMPFELSGVALVGAWVLVSVAAVLATRWRPLEAAETDASALPLALQAVATAGIRFGLLIPAFVAYLLAILHLFSFEYPPTDIGEAAGSGIPFLGNGLAIAYLLGAAAVAGYFLRDAGLRRWMACLGGALLMWSMPFELSGVALVGAWVLVSVATVLATRWRPLDAAKTDSDALPPALRAVSTAGVSFGLLIPACAAYLLAMLHFFSFEYPPADIGEAAGSGIPFLHLQGVALAYLIAGAAIPAMLAGHSWPRFASANLAGGLVLWTMPFELSGVALVGGWSAATVLVTLANRWPPLAAETTMAEQDRNLRVPIQTLLMRGGVMITAVAGWLLALAHLVTVEYPVDRIASDRGDGVPFLNLNGLALAIVLSCSALIGTGRFNRLIWVALAVFAVIYAMPFETSSVALVAGWTLITALAMAAGRWQPLATTPLADVESGSAAEVTLSSSMNEAGRLLVRRGLDLPAIAAWLFAMTHFFAVELEPATSDGWTRPSTPFVDGPTLATLFVVAAAVIGSMLTCVAILRIGWRVGAMLTVGSLMPFEVGLAATVVAWAALAIVPLLLLERDEEGRPIYQGVLALLSGAGFVLAIVRVAPPARLFVDAESRIDHALLWSGASAAFGALTLLFSFAFSRMRAYPQSKWLAIVSGALFVYLLSVGVVDHFQSRVGEGSSLGSLQKQAQVGLSILWAVLGGATFVAGVLRFGLPIRVSGLVLLGLATVKVFLWDMSTLDASYRVLSFIGLGVLLLASSLLYQRHVVRTDDEGENDTKKPPRTGKTRQW